MNKATAAETRTASDGALYAFIASLGVSRLGDAIYMFALPWLAYELTHSSVILGTLYAAEFLPVVFFGAFMGAFVDRWNRRAVMLAADAARAVLIATIPCLYVFGALPLWYLYAVTVLMSLATMVFDVATGAVIPELANGNLDKANAVHQSVLQGAIFVGPILAGILVAFVGAVASLWLDVLSFAATMAVVASVREFSTPTAPKRPILKEIREGYDWMRGEPAIFTLAVQACIGNLGFSMVNAIMLYYMRSSLGLGAALSGTALSICGLGGIVGGLAIVPLAGKFRRGLLYPWILSFGLAGYLTIAFVATWWGAGIGFGMVFACNIAWVVLSTSARQERIPSELRGRVLGMSRLLSASAMPVGSALGGALVPVVGPALVFVFAAASKGTEILIARFSPMRGL